MAAHQASPSLGFSRQEHWRVGCHFLLQCRKVKSESEVSQSCPTPSNSMDCSPPGSSIHGICQARVLEFASSTNTYFPSHSGTSENSHRYWQNSWQWELLKPLLDSENRRGMRQGHKWGGKIQLKFRIEFEKLVFSLCPLSNSLDALLQKVSFTVEYGSSVLS